jgi:hypothetical protein
MTAGLAHFLIPLLCTRRGWNMTQVGSALAWDAIVPEFESWRFDRFLKRSGESMDPADTEAKLTVAKITAFADALRDDGEQTDVN